MHRSLSGKGSESTWRIRNISFGSLSYNVASKMLQFFLKRRKILGFIYRSLTDNNISLTIKNRPYKLFNVLTAILIICICVNNDICSMLKACINSGHKTFSESFISLKAYNVVYAPVSRDFNCVINASVINYQIFNFVYSVYMLRQIIKCYLKSL